MTEAALSLADPVALFKSVVAEKRYTQNEWHAERDGRHYFCLAAAFGKPGEIESASDCPAGLLPQWLFELMPSLDDGVSAGDVPWLFEGFAARIDAMVNLDAAAWQRIQTGFMVASLRQAAAAAQPVQPDPAPEYWDQVSRAIEQVCTALETGQGLEEAKAAAWAAARAAWAAEAAEAAARAAWAAASAAEAAEAAAWAAARAAWAAEAAEAAARAAWAAASAAEAAEAAEAADAAAWKQIAETLFAIIDAELAADE